GCPSGGSDTHSDDSPDPATRCRTGRGTPRPRPPTSASPRKTGPSPATSPGPLLPAACAATHSRPSCHCSPRYSSRSLARAREAGAVITYMEAPSSSPPVHHVRGRILGVRLTSLLATDGVAVNSTRFVGQRSCLFHAATSPWVEVNASRGVLWPWRWMSHSLL